MAALHNTYRRAHPGSYFSHYHRVRPVSHYHFPLDSHTAYDVTVLSVPVCGLILIHKIHINGIIGNFLVKLGMEMHQRLSVLL